MVQAELLRSLKHSSTKMTQLFIKGIPDLDTVTTVNNITTNSIQVGGVFVGSDYPSDSPDSFGMYSTAGDLIIVKYDDGTGCVNTAGFLIIDSSNGLTALSNTANPSPTALILFDLQSTTACFRPPCMTTAQKNAIAAPNGSQVFDTTLQKLCVRESGAWVTK